VNNEVESLTVVERRVADGVGFKNPADTGLLTNELVHRKLSLAKCPDDILFNELWRNHVAQRSRWHGSSLQGNCLF
jgi:hypothetical protein